MIRKKKCHRPAKVRAKPSMGSSWPMMVSDDVSGGFLSAPLSAQKLSVRKHNIEHFGTILLSGPPTEVSGTLIFQSSQICWYLWTNCHNAIRIFNPRLSIMRNGYTYFKMKLHGFRQTSLINSRHFSLNKFRNLPAPLLDTSTHKFRKQKVVTRWWQKLF